MDERFDAVDKRLDAMDERFDAVDKRLDAMDERFDAMDKRLDKMDQRMDVFEVKLDRTAAKLEDLQLDVKLFERNILRQIHLLKDANETVEQILRLGKLIPS